MRRPLWTWFTFPISVASVLPRGTRTFFPLRHFSTPWNGSTLEVHRPKTFALFSVLPRCFSFECCKCRCPLSTKYDVCDHETKITTNRQQRATESLAIRVLNVLVKNHRNVSISSTLQNTSRILCLK